MGLDVADTDDRSLEKGGLPAIHAFLRILEEEGMHCSHPVKYLDIVDLVEL